MERPPGVAPHPLRGACPPVWESLEWVKIETYMKSLQNRNHLTLGHILLL